jgi:Tol biopolymer transport system component
MNVKSDVSQPVTIKIFDISNRVVSKETVNVIAGDNILKVYTAALPSSAYRIALYDVNGKQLGITDFNKL